MSSEFILSFWKAISSNDIEKIKNMMNDDQYTMNIGLEAIGIAFTRKHNEIAYEILSQDGALDKFFDHPFMIDNGLRESVKNYIIKSKHIKK